MTYLGDDEHGTWLWAGPETIAQHREDPPRERGIGFVTLIPNGEWWLAMFFSDHPDYDIYVNVGTPCEWLGDTVRQVDLDLDVVRYHDGTCAVLDEDEFEERKIRLEYPPWLITGATKGAAAALDLLESATEPFGSDAARWNVTRP
jgi:protein associated with RNAse G/E